jgi:uncharacterized protein (TIGR02466 family)
VGTERQPWLEASEVIPMFPTLVWKFELHRQLHESIDASILRALSGLRHDLPPLAPAAAWQSVQTLHEREELRDLVACIERAAQGILRFLSIGASAIEITACWANVLSPGASHKLHSHPNNYLSGVYYVRTYAGGNTIQFHDPRMQTAVIRPPVTALTADNTDQVVVGVNNGTLLMFPAYLQHSVDANRSAQERVSVSFNLMFSAFPEQLSKPLW